MGETSLGIVLVASTDKGVCATLLGDTAEDLNFDLRERFPMAEMVTPSPRDASWVRRCISIVEQPERARDLPLDVRGTAFQQSVWKVLQSVPAGTTVTYSEIACRMGRPRSTRAVAGACASNPIAIIIPCHRVIRSDGGLGGYRWGIERKRALLERELLAARSKTDGATGSTHSPFVRRTRSLSTAK